MNVSIRAEQKLNTHYKDIKDVSGLGAKFSPDQSVWFIPDDHPQPALLHKWLPVNNPRIYINVPKEREKSALHLQNTS